MIASALSPLLPASGFTVILLEIVETLRNLLRLRLYLVVVGLGRRVYSGLGTALRRFCLLPALQDWDCQRVELRVRGLAHQVHFEVYIP